jgi:hypothetical protein
MSEMNRRLQYDQTIWKQCSLIMAETTTRKCPETKYVTVGAEKQIFIGSSDLIDVQYDG